jgi:hypothetical protein
VKPALALPLALLVAVAVRVPFWQQAMRTPVDGDTAIVGLMARHPGEGTTMWGQPYGSPLDAWVAMPFVAALGADKGKEALRLTYFLLGLAFIPAAYYLARGLDPRAALPAAMLMACPPPYFLILATLPPPFYPTTLLLCALMLLLTLRIAEAWNAGEEARGRLALGGALAGLALWTHLMAASTVLASAAYLFLRGRGRRRLLAFALLPLLITSAPWWTRALADREATRVVSVSGRQETMAEHLRAVVPQLHWPLGGLLGTHVPVVPDDPTHVLPSPGVVAAGLILIYGVLLIMAARASRENAGAKLLLGAAALALAAFPFPVRSGPHAIRFLTPMYLPVLALVVWAPVAHGRERRAWVAVLALAVLHLGGASSLLAEWRSLDRAQAPFLLPDLGPVRRALAARGIRRAYASYGPAYRLTYESGETIVGSQPWNERFRHYPLPFLDEVRFAKNVAWVLTPTIPTDLPAPKAFETALASIGGEWRRSEAGPAVVYSDFVPPFGVTVEPLPEGGDAGDRDLRTWRALPPTEPTTFALSPPRALDAVTIAAALEGPGLLRSLDVETSADGSQFEVVARRRRREERDDLRWVNGHPQYVIDHDFLAVPLGGGPIAAIRLTPVASEDSWAVGEILLHPAAPKAERAPWDEWLDPNLDWAARQRALAANPLPAREDWYYRLRLAARHSR